MVGSDWSLVEEFDEMFCVPSDHYSLAIPLKMTINESMDTCKKLNNSIIPFQEDLETFCGLVQEHYWRGLSHMDTPLR